MSMALCRDGVPSSVLVVFVMALSLTSQVGSSMASLPPATSLPATNSSAKVSDAHSPVPSSGIGSVIATVPVGTRPGAIVYNAADGEVYVATDGLVVVLISSSALSLPHGTLGAEAS